MRPEGPEEVQQLNKGSRGGLAALRCKMREGPGGLLCPGPGWHVGLSVRASVGAAGEEPGSREVGRALRLLLSRDRSETSDGVSLEACFLWAGPV